MQLCNAEIIKKLKTLDQQKERILADERRNCTTSYVSEADKIPAEYHFNETRDAVSKVNAITRYFKGLLAKANATVEVEGFGMTIGEALVYLSQLNNERGTLSHLANREAKSRQSGYRGEVEYTETNYDVAEARRCLDEITAQIQNLQMAIDRTNLTNVVEVDINKTM